MDPQRQAAHLHSQGMFVPAYTYARGGPNQLVASVAREEQRGLAEWHDYTSEQSFFNRVANFWGWRNREEHNVFADPSIPTAPRHTHSTTLVAPEELARGGYKYNPYVWARPVTHHVHTIGDTGNPSTE
jgi:hypothetical protein